MQYVEDDLRRITNVNIQDRDDLKQREVELIQHQRDIEDKLREILEFELPLAICAKLCRELEDRLELEQAFQLKDKGRQALKPQLENLLFAVFEDGEEPKPKLHFSQIEFYRAKISKIWYELFNADSTSLGDDTADIDEIWHDINEKKYHFIMQQIEHLSQNLIPEFDELTRDRQRKMTELRSIQRNLKNDIASLQWESIVFGESNAHIIPEIPGIYTFLIKHNVANHPQRYLCYVGKTERTLKKRYSEYLREAVTISGRPKILRLLNEWEGNVEFCYTLVEKENIKTLEKRLIDAFVPPFNSNFSANIGRIRGGF